jgi:hypothetical protein
MKSAKDTPPVHKNENPFLRVFFWKNSEADKSKLLCRVRHRLSDKLRICLIFYRFFPFLDILFMYQ